MPMDLPLVIAPLAVRFRRAPLAEALLLQLSCFGLGSLWAAPSAFVCGPLQLVAVLVDHVTLMCPIGAICPRPGLRVWSACRSRCLLRNLLDLAVLTIAQLGLRVLATVLLLLMPVLKLLLL